MDAVLLPSTATQTWTEQFGRVIVEAQGAGAAAVQAVTAEEATFHRFRAAGLQHIEVLIWDHVAAQQLALYDRVQP